MTLVADDSVAGVAAATTPTPIDRYLHQQADLTAVERFAQRHEAELIPRQARYYRDLIPLAQPGPGEQFGFEVDLDACTGCKACVSACHSLNGLDEDESWRSVGLLHGGTPAAPFQQTVTTACHHCVDPACLNGCPVDAYEKDPVTGIVVHLDDQCIGCGYCTLTCPYEVPRFNPTRGIVRKCDMCHGRLAVGEAPACVQACPNGAIRIAVVGTSAMAEAAVDGALVPGAPPSSITVPTTVYRTTRGPLHDARAADHFSARPADAHTPLAAMLVLTQLSVGAFTVDLALRTWAGFPVRPANGVIALAAGVLALGASVLHLGRPRLAFRAVIGLRHSWLSREVLAFGVFAALAAPSAVALWVGRPIPVLDYLVAAAGLGGVGCSVMIYATTRRHWWRARAIVPKFALTTVACGLAVVLCTSPTRSVALLLAAVAAVKLAGEATIFRHLRHPDDDERARTALLMARDLRTTTVRRFAAGAGGGVALPLLAAAATAAWLAAMVAVVAMVVLTAGELLERSLFFRAVTSPRMPGGLP